MENKDIDNLIIIANILEVVERTINKIGYDYQAPLSPEDQQEVNTHAVKTAITELAKGVTND